MLIARDFLFLTYEEMNVRDSLILFVATCRPIDFSLPFCVALLLSNNTDKSIGSKRIFQCSFKVRMELHLGLEQECHYL